MRKIRALLADDHEVVRAGIRNALTTMSILEIVGEVGDGPTLLHTLTTEQIDFLLIDVSMPNFEPISAIQQIRTTFPSLKILVVSAYDDDIYVQGLLGAGVDGYHLKDQPLADLRLAVGRVLAGEKWVSSRLVSKLVRYHDSSPESITLTPRQQDILLLLRDGLDNQSIARKIGLSVKTVENHLTRLYRQLNVQSRLEAVNYVIQHPDILVSKILSSKMQSRPQAKSLAEELFDPKITVLLVDDNKRYRRQLCRMVGKAQSQAAIYEAENIAQAREAVRLISPQLALVDVVLGDEDGISCVRQLKALVPTMRVVLISAYPDREFHQRGLEAGAVAFLDKKDLDVAAVRQVVADIT